MNKMKEIQNRVITAFRQQYGEAPTFLVRAPGRVNLIGDHTDYNDGFVLPMAIDRAIWVALRPSSNPTVTLHSLDLEETATFSLMHLEKGGPSWAEYIKGVAWAMQAAGHTLSGWQGVITGDVPMASGLSSSAAIELAAARAFTAVSNIAWHGPQMAQLGQQAENEWVGMNCGIMDQMISAVGQAGQALLIDCRSLATELVPLPAETAVVILNTTVRRGLVDSAYNERRRQCETAAQFFAVPALRDVTLSQFQAKAGGLDKITRRRAHHVITENARVQQAAAAMKTGDAVHMGQLMNESHISLRDDFEVSCPELDVIVACAQNQPGCYGARMTGAGFGGCAVALVANERAKDMITAIATCYQQKTNLTPAIYVCQATDGAQLIH